MTSPDKPRIGCAGWALEKRVQDRFPATGTHLQRYAAVFPCVEINSSFYRPHKPETYGRWADSVPETFRFSAKVPKEITHVRRLMDFRAPLEKFLSEVTRLGPKLGPLLVQLPPSGSFHPRAAAEFFRGFRERYSGLLAVEPRHPTWFAKEASALLEEHKIARVAADPAIIPAAAEPSGWKQLVYRRLHGSPRIYYSDYSEERLTAYAEAIAREARASEVYCIFDNTAEGRAIPNALALESGLLKEPSASG